MDNRCVSSYTSASQNESYFWFYLPHVTEKSKLRIEYAKNGSSSSWDTDQIQQAANGWWRVGPWTQPGNMSWVQTVTVEGLVSIRIPGPAASSIKPEFASGETLPIPPTAEAWFAVDLYNRMFEDDRCKDVTFELKDGQEKAHKAILVASSDAFAAMLTGSMQEAKEGRVKLECLSRVEMRVFLRMLYTGCMVPEDWYAQHDCDDMPLTVLCSVAQLSKKYLVTSCLEIAVEALKARLADAAKREDVEVFQEIAAAAIRMDDGALRFASLNVARESKAILERYQMQGLRPEVQAELQCIWPPEQPTRKLRRVA